MQISYKSTCCKRVMLKFKLGHFMISLRLGLTAGQNYNQVNDVDPTSVKSTINHTTVTSTTLESIAASCSGVLEVPHRGGEPMVMISLMTNKHGVYGDAYQNKICYAEMHKIPFRTFWPDKCSPFTAFKFSHPWISGHFFKPVALYATAWLHPKAEYALYLDSDTWFTNLGLYSVTPKNWIASAAVNGPNACMHFANPSLNVNTGAFMHRLHTYKNGQIVTDDSWSDRFVCLDILHSWWNVSLFSPWTSHPHDQASIRATILLKMSLGRQNAQCRIAANKFARDGCKRTMRDCLKSYLHGISLCGAGRAMERCHSPSAAPDKSRFCTLPTIHMPNATEVAHTCAFTSCPGAQELSKVVIMHAGSSLLRCNLIKLAKAPLQECPTKTIYMGECKNTNRILDGSVECNCERA